MVPCVVLSLILSPAGCGQEAELCLTDSSAQSDLPQDSSSQSSQTEGTSDGISHDDPSASANIYVYICGAVKNPGVYELAADSRIYQLVEQAGGLSKKADQTSVNLAEPLQDGQMVRIPEKGSAGSRDTAETTEGTSAQPSDTASGSENVSDGTGRVNINTATREQLMTLTGIGESKAERILEYREKNGSFQKIEDIMKIAGIKEGTFEKIKNSISVQ